MLGRFLSEVKRRRIVRVAGVYAVTCWAVFQVASSLFPVLHLPAWTVTLTAVLLMLGLPVALIIAWAFEASPDGVRLTAAAPADAPKLKFTLADWSLVAAAIAILGLSGAEMAGVMPAIGRAPAASGPSVRSVAVLPFVNMSDQKDGDLFADGLSEEVINGLAQIPDLKVAGRTSAFYFKGRNDDLRVIGQKLGVANVVEGSVRREGDKLRVTVQLIKVSDGFHMWSETYDRTMDDAFAIQTEIAKKVAEVLKAKLDLNGPESAAPDPDAFRDQLVATARLRRLGLNEVTEARKTFKRLIDTGEGNAAVYAGYAQATQLLAQNYLALDFTSADAEAKAAIDKALSLDPNSVDALLAKGMRCIIRTIRMSDQACIAESRAAYQRALTLAPRNPEVLTTYANFLNHQDEPVQALELAERAVAQDPLNRVAILNAAKALAAMSRFDEAEQRYRSAIDLFPDLVDAKQDLGLMLVEEGKLDRAEPWLKAAAAPGTDPSAALQLAHVYMNLGMIPQFKAAAAPLSALAGPAARIPRALELVTSQDYRGSLAFCEQAYAETGDGVWSTSIIEMAVMVGDYERARAMALKVNPGLYGPDPQVDGSLAFDAVLAAQISDQLGDHAQAKRILTRLLAATAPKPQLRLSNERRLSRILAYGVLGDKDSAVRELQAAQASGYRTLFDINAWVRIDRYPMAASVRADPRFQAILAQIDADNARMRGVLTGVK
ncbi:MAG: tetratricopeptide repeat protein [Proteobacteria bacterium]|nr:tetratricopeptide repeat protein [Pseudomonadota bacterium]